MNTAALILATAAGVVGAAAITIPDVAPPATKKTPVTDTYFGDAVVDNYRWLEDWSNKDVQAWSEAQNVRARKILDKLPARDAIEKRMTQLMSFESPSYRDVRPQAGPKDQYYFSLKQQPPKQQTFIVVASTLADVAGERVVVDPNVIDSTGGTSIDFYEPSPDGKRLAVSLSKGGSESGELHIVDVATGKDVDVVPRANSGTAGGTVAWTKDGGGVWYTRHPQAPEVGADDDGFFQQVAFHKIGTPATADVVEMGAVVGGKRDDLPRNAENFLESSDDGRFVVDMVQKGDGGEYDLWLRGTSKSSKWRKVAPIEERIVAVRFAVDGTLWMLSRKDAGRGKIMSLPPTAASAAQATLVVPEGDATIESFEVTATKLFLVEQLGGPSRVRVVSLTGGASPKELPILPVSAAGGVHRVKGDDVVFVNTSFTSPTAWFTADGNGSVKPTALKQEPPTDMSNVVVERREATSKDGTKIPFSLVRLKDTSSSSGDAPTLLTGYGGFDVPETPGFSKSLPAWLEQGGVYVMANLRGGGEFGEAWHQAGMKTTKQNVFDDFVAVAQKLVDDRVTNLARLAIQGGSNGGLLMGAALTQRPDLFKCVVAQVGYFDMLRYETKPNGAFNNTEYGSVANETEYRALSAYSPYHHIDDAGKAKYPPTLFLTGANDPRVDPLHSRKMVARLQAAKAQAILRTSGSTGHGGGTPLTAKIAENVDIYAFLFAELNVAYKPVVK